MYNITDTKNKIGYRVEDKTRVAEIVGVHRNTIANRLRDSGYAEINGFIIIEDPIVIKSKRGSCNLERF